MVGFMTELNELIKKMRPKEAKNETEFLSSLKNAPIDRLVELYNEIGSRSPTRKSKYLFQRVGSTKPGTKNGITEDRLAIGLWRKFKTPAAMSVTQGQLIEMLDYQVPLRSARTDNGFGEIDLLGLINKKRLAILELKAVGGDAPAAAVFQALVYSALLEPNLDCINEELEQKNYEKVQRRRPDIIVIARSDYWHFYHHRVRNWLPEVTDKLCKIAQSLSIHIQFIELEIAAPEPELIQSIQSPQPKIPGRVKAKLLFCSKE